MQAFIDLCYALAKVCLAVLLVMFISVPLFAFLTASRSAPTVAAPASVVATADGGCNPNQARPFHPFQKPCSYDDYQAWIAAHPDK